jgi:hypothetical protein
LSVFVFTQLSFFYLPFRQQRNVGILEKIIQTLNNSSSIEMYHTQNHVLQQLEEKVKLLLLQQPKQNTAIVKLQRDFQRVQMRATQLQEIANKKIAIIVQQQQQQMTNQSIRQPLTGMSNTNNYNNTATNDYATDEAAMFAEQQRLQQLQIQQDRLSEEIMREREEEIRNINRGMHQVNEIYKDLAHIVASQQDDIDQIETQMDDARANAESGLQQVEKANEKFGSTQCSIM